MGTQTDNAFETRKAGLILRKSHGLFVGSSTPGTDAPDAPLGSIYLRSNGERYTRTAFTGSGIEADFSREDPQEVGGASASQLSWKFSTTIVAANPGSKTLRYDSATPGSVTKLFINDTTRTNFDSSALLTALTAGDRIYIQEAATGAFLLTTVVSVVDNTGWFTITVTVDSSGTLPADGGTLGMQVFLGGGGGGGGTPGDQAFTQARRTTNFSIPTSTFTDVDLDTTDDENDTTVVEHDNPTNDDRILLKENKPYELYYSVDCDPPSGQSNFHSFVESRITANDVQSPLDGSLSGDDCLDDSSLVGDQTVGTILSKKFFYTPSAAPEFVTLQLRKTNSSGSPTINAAADRVTFTAKRLSGEKGATGPAGSGSSTLRVGHTYAISGEIKVPVGQTDFIIPFFVSLASGQTADLVKARHQIQAGTSVTCKLQNNGVDITGFTGISVTTTPTDTDPTDVVLANNDELALVVTAVSGTPQNMTFTIFLELTN